MQSIFGNPLLVLGVLAVAVFLLRFVRRRSTQADDDQRQTYELAPFMSPAEATFMRVLLAANNDECLVMGKVRVADLLNVSPGLLAKDRVVAFNQIKAKHIDFILCSRQDFRPLLAIELDDSSHERASRVSRDKFLDTAFLEAGLPLLRFKCRASYETEVIAQQIAGAIKSVPVDAQLASAPPEALRTRSKRSRARRVEPDLFAPQSQETDPVPSATAVQSVDQEQRSIEPLQKSQ